MGGLYDILEAYRLQDPKFTYEGLYQDPPRDDSVYYSGALKTYPYGLNFDGPSSDSTQSFRFSSFPQDYEKSLFNPRVGKPEQSIFYNQPFNINNVAPQDVNTGIMTQAPTQNFEFLSSAYEDDDEEQVESLTKEPSGIEKLFNFLQSIPTPRNLLTGGLESLRGLNQRLRSTDFGQSQNLVEYLQRREARKDAERLKTVGQQLQQASQEGGGYQPTSREQNVARTESRVSGGRSRAYGL